MTEQAVIYTPTGDAKTTTPEPGMIREVLAWNPHLMLVRHKFEKGWKGARHSHPHHQLVYVTSGRIRFMADGKSWELGAGDSVVVNGGVEHEATALEASEALDVFTPFRQEYA
jgi:quercetin dioxygenase-like cupin family protein